jgi:hypothetical protein
MCALSYALIISLIPRESCAFYTEIGIFRKVQERSSGESIITISADVNAAPQNQPGRETVARDPGLRSTVEMEDDLL